jgi:hypothetical protein
MSPQMMQLMQQRKNQMMAQQLGAQGRMGDTTMAHLTPGEMTVPPQVQTPKVMHTLQQAFKKDGLSPAQFTVGSPAASTNPATGAQEFNIFSSLLPILGSIGGGIVGGPLGAAAGSTVGGLASGQQMGQALMGGALAGVGNVAGGAAANAFSPGTAATGAGLDASAASTADALNAAPASNAGGISVAAGGAPAGGAANSLSSQQMAALTGTQTAAKAASSTGTQTSGGLLDNLGKFGQMANYTGNSPYQTLNGMLPQGASTAGLGGAAAGSALGSALGAPAKTNVQYPPGFNTPMTPVSQLPSAQTQLGQNTTVQPQANFTNYNPATNNPAAYNFFPTSTSGA